MWWSDRCEVGVLLTVEIRKLRHKWLGVVDSRRRDIDFSGVLKEGAMKGDGKSHR